MSDDKKPRKSVVSSRPYLLRRSTASGTSGSVKRRSFRFKKNSNKDASKENVDIRKVSGKEVIEYKKSSGFKDTLRDKLNDTKKCAHKDVTDMHESKKIGNKENDNDRKWITR